MNPQEIVKLIEDTGLTAITAFRMAIKDIHNGQFRSAAYRIASDLDKVMSSNDRATFRQFIAEHKQ